MSGPASLINDCFLHDKDRLRHAEALEHLKNRLTRIAGTETIAAQDGLGRILAEEICAPHNVPLHTNSAVDGYAFCHADLTEQPLPVSGLIAAGDLNPTALEPQTAVRIFTGAPMPAGAETIAMQEDCAEENGKVSLPTELKIGANCRLAGEDLKTGDPFLKQGTRLAAPDLAALASVGLIEIPVYKHLKVALFSNGKEMRIPDGKTALQVGEVYDANQPLLSALCASLPIELENCGIIDDDADAALKAIQTASATHDIILTTGGASRGDEDHMLTVLDQLGKRHLWQLAVKPGRPMMFGQIPRNASKNDCLFFGLPGNPVAAMVCFLFYVRPALLSLAGADWAEPARFQVPADFEISNKKPDRREFLRGKLQKSDDGTLRVKKFPRDGSGLISSLRQADGLIELSEEVRQVKNGDLVSFIPFSAFD